MTNQHPITPPPELVQQWMTESRYQDCCYFSEYIAARAAQWGADQELEACCEWVTMETPASELHLRSARRPKPPSLKEQLLQKLEHIRDVADKYRSTQNAIDDLREALEALPND